MNPFNWGSPLKCICLPRIFVSFCPFENTIIEIKNKVNIMTAAAAPPPAILAEIEKKGFDIPDSLELDEDEQAF